MIFASGGNPYGTTAVAGKVTDEVSASIRHQAKRMVEVTAKLA